MEAKPLLAVVQVLLMSSQTTAKERNSNTGSARWPATRLKSQTELDIMKTGITSEVATEMKSLH